MYATLRRVPWLLGLLWLLGRPAAAQEPAALYFPLGARRVVLRIGAEPGWARGPARLVTEQEGMQVRREVDPARLPPRLAALRGAALRLYKQGRPLCETQVTGLHMLGWAEPGADELGRWRGEGADGKSGAPWPRARVAEDVWEIGGHLLIGELAAPCPGADWALPAAQPPPVLAKARRPGAELLRLALAELRRLPAYRQLQREYEERRDLERPRTPRWESYRGDGPRVRALQLGATTLVYAVVDTAEWCSSDFGGRLWALWQVEGPPGQQRLSLRSVPAPPEIVEPEAALDLDGDGVLELLLPGPGLLRSVGAIYRAPEVLEMPRLGCAC